jgi:hypothetical protein
MRVARCRYRAGISAFKVNSYLETGGTPVDKLNSPLGADIGNGGVDVLGDNVSTVEQATSHVLALARVALDHLVVGLEARNRHLRNRVGLVEGCC